METKVFVKADKGLVITILTDGWDGEYKGVAKCSATDTFDEVVGRRVSAMRAWKKFYQVERQDQKAELKRLDKRRDAIQMGYDKSNAKITNINESLAKMLREI